MLWLSPKICVTSLAIKDQLKTVFCVFQQFSGSPRFQAYKNGNNLQPGALKVTKSEFFLTKSVSHLCHFVERWEKVWSKS